MATRTLGGKARRAPSAGAFLQAPQTLSEEALAPLADDLPRGFQARRNGVVVEPLGGVQHDPGADDIPIR